ncbi:MAG: hypoxanthine phosphoribosyltransferase [Desulfuromonadaceae bacterium]
MKLLYSKEHIAAEVARLGAEISRDYAGRDIVAVVVLKGAVIFAADLLRNISIPVTLEFIRAASYHDNTHSSRDVKISMDPHSDITDKHVIIVDDILDSGHTLKALSRLLSEHNPASLRLCTLLDKKERREADIEANYVGMETENKFVVGYGLDLAGKYRHLGQIYTI